MGDGFDVDPEEIRGMGFELRDGLEPPVRAAGEVPSADAGLMTLVIEKAIGALLDGLTGYAGNVAVMGDDMVRSALHYHWADQEAQANMARLLMPGTTPGEADAMVADAPGSLWAQVEDEELGPLRDLFSVDGGPPDPTTTGGEHGDGLDALLLGPMATGSDGSDGSDGRGRHDAD